MFHDESWKPVYFGFRRSKVTRQENIAGVLFALLWVLACFCLSSQLFWSMMFVADIGSIRFERIYAPFFWSNVSNLRAFIAALFQCCDVTWLWHPICYCWLASFNLLQKKKQLICYLQCFVVFLPLINVGFCGLFILKYESVQDQKIFGTFNLQFEHHNHIRILAACLCIFVICLPCFFAIMKTETQMDQKWIILW